MKNIILTLRPHQWVKNLFIFLPLFFSGGITNIQQLSSLSITFVSFCFLASSIYVFNDILDIDKDKNHPIKSKRPIASNKISIREGYIICFLCIGLSILFSSILDDESRLYMYLLSSIYFIMNILYCLKLKEIEIIDSFIISLGFVFRILIGGYIPNIWISQWIIIMTFLLALFLAFAKRRDDIYIEREREKERRNYFRKSVTNYTLPFIDHILGINASIIMVSYIMYTISNDVIMRMGTPHLYITSFFVFVGIIRYLQITIVKQQSGSPTLVLLKDKFLLTTILCWIFSFYIIIYL